MRKWTTRWICTVKYCTTAPHLSRTMAFPWKPGISWILPLYSREGVLLKPLSASTKRLLASTCKSASWLIEKTASLHNPVHAPSVLSQQGPVSLLTSPTAQFAHHGFFLLVLSTERGPHLISKAHRNQFSHFLLCPSEKPILSIPSNSSAGLGADALKCKCRKKWMISKCNPLRRSLCWSPGTLVKLRFLISRCTPLRRTRASILQNAGTLCGDRARWSRRMPGIFFSLISSRTLCEDRACRMHGMQGKLCFCNLESDLLGPIQRSNDTEILRRVQRSCASAPTASYWGDLDTDIFDKRSSYTDLAQVLLQDPAEEILHKRSYRTRRVRGMQVKLRFFDFEVQPSAEIVRADGPDAKILTQRSCARDPPAYRELAQETRVRRSCTSRPAESCWGDLNTNILHKRFAHTDLAQEILIQWSCTSGPSGCWWRRSWHRLGIHYFQHTVSDLLPG